MAGHYDLTIDQGATLRRIFQWLDEDLNPIDLTGCHLRARIFRADHPNPELVLTDEAGNLTITDPLAGEFDLEIADEVTDSMLWETGSWRLDALHPGGDITALREGAVTVRSRRGDSNGTGQDETIQIVTTGIQGPPGPAWAGMLAPEQMPGLVGDVSSVAGTVQTVIGADKVLFAMLNSATWSNDTGLAADSSTMLPTQHAVKTYVDNFAQGLQWRAAVACATNGPITLTGEQTVDGVLTNNSRVLVKNQTTPKDNGIYVSSAGSWIRAQDANTGPELVSATMFVTAGILNGDTQWTCTSDAIDLIAGDGIQFAQVSGAGTYTAGAGLTLTGNSFSITPGGVTSAMIAPLTAPLLALNGTAAAPAYSFTSDTTTGIRLSGSLQLGLVAGGADQCRVNIVGLDLGAKLIAFGANFGAPDVVLVRDGAAGTLAQRNGVNPQIFRIYNTYTDANNYERAFIQWTGNVLQIGTLSLGTGIARETQIVSGQSIKFYVNGYHWQLTNGGHWLALNDNAYDIGGLPSNRPRAIYSAGIIHSAGTTPATGIQLGTFGPAGNGIFGNPGAHGITITTGNAPTLTTAPTGAGFWTVGQWNTGLGFTMNVGSGGAGNSNRVGEPFTIGSGQSTGNGVAGDIIFQTTPAGVSGTQANPYVEAMRIRQGNVGIGTSGPLTNLHVAGPGSPAALTIGGASDSGILNFSTGSSIRFQIFYNSTGLTIGSPFASKNHIVLDRDTGNVQFASAAIVTVGPTGAGGTPAGNVLLRSGDHGGGSNNIAGSTLTIRAGLATGNAASGDLLFQTGDVGVSGITLQTASTKMTVKVNGGVAISNGLTTTGATDLLINPTTKTSGNLFDVQINGSSKFYVRFDGLISATSTLLIPAISFGPSIDVTLSRGAPGILRVGDTGANTAGHLSYTSGILQPLTVATLPAAVAGRYAYISDGDAALAWGATVINSGAGATKYLVWYNGTNWTIAGK